MDDVENTPPAKRPTRKFPALPGRKVSKNKKEEKEKQGRQRLPMALQEALVHEVQKHPELWDMTCDGFHNRMKKAKLWQQISSELRLDGGKNE